MSSFAFGLIGIWLVVKESLIGLTQPGELLQRILPARSVESGGAHLARDAFFDCLGQFVGESVLPFFCAQVRGNDTRRVVLLRVSVEMLLVQKPSPTYPVKPSVCFSCVQRRTWIKNWRF